MSGRDPVGAIRRHSNSINGDEYGPKFTRCVDRRDSQVHKVWTFGEDCITTEVHPTARVDVGAGFIGEFSTNYLIEDGRRIPMFGVNSINGSIQWLGVPYPLRTDGHPWADNMLIPSPA